MTTFGGVTIPPIFSGNDSNSGGGPFPDISVSPIRMVSTSFADAGNVANIIDFRFNTSPSVSVMLTNRNAVNTIIAAANQPQWTDTNLAPPPSSASYSFRVVFVDPASTGTIGNPGYQNFPANVGVWFPINTTRFIGVDRPASGTRNMICVAQIALGSDLGTILGQATYTLTYTRT